MQRLWFHKTVNFKFFPAYLQAKSKPIYLFLQLVTWLIKTNANFYDTLKDVYCSPAQSYPNKPTYNTNCFFQNTVNHMIKVGD